VLGLLVAPYVSAHSTAIVTSDNHCFGCGLELMTGLTAM